MITVKFKLEESEVEIIEQRAKEISKIKNPLVEDLVECYIFDEILDAAYGRKTIQTTSNTSNHED